MGNPIAIQTLSGATPTWDALYKIAEITSTANTTVTLEGPGTPDAGVLIFTNGGTHTLSLVADGVTYPITVVSGAGKVTIVEWVFTGTLHAKATAAAEAAAAPSEDYPYRAYLAALSGAVAVWGLDEAAGATSFVDSKGTLHLSKSGSVQSGNASLVGSEPSGASVRFATSVGNGTLSLAHSAAIDFGVSSSFSLVMNLTVGVGDEGTIMAKILTSGTFRGWSLDVNSSTTSLQFFMIDDWGAGTYNRWTIPLPAASVHFVLVWNGTALAAYANGTALTLTQTNTATLVNLTNTEALTIGSRTASKYCGDVAADGVGVYNVALTATDALNLYNESIA